MYTGYDNYWMHSRPKPVQNLPKNDNYNCARLTDSYKHMQNRGCPSQLNNYIPSQNNAASFPGKDHYRNSHVQSMWPSSVYSLPYMPSHANNLSTQEPFYSHTNNFVHSFPNSQAQEKHAFGHLEMSNGNVNTMHTTMHNTMHTTVHNTMHTTLHNTMPNTMHTTLHNTMPNTMHTTLHNTMPNTMHTTLHNTMPNTMHTTLHNTMPNTMHTTLHNTMPNTMHTTMHNTNTSTLASNGLVHAQSNKNTNTQIPRIRVKDVFSLNNQSIDNYLQLNDYFRTRQQKEPPAYSAHCNRPLEPQIQREYFRPKNANLVESSKSSRFEHRTAEQTCSNTRVQYQNSYSFYQQNNGSSLGNFEFNSGSQIESNISSASFQSRIPASLPSQLLTQESIPERGLQSCQEIAGQGNAQPGHGGEKVTPTRNLAELQHPNYSNINYSRSCGLNERAPENSTSQRNVHCDVQRSATVINNVQCDLRENITKINEANLESRNSASNTKAKSSPSITSKSFPLKETNKQQNCSTQIAIPNTGKSSFIGPNGSEDTERNSTLNLQNFLDQTDKNYVIDGNTHNIIDQESEVINSIPLPIGESCFISQLASPETTSIPDNSGNEGAIVTQKNSVPADSTSLISPRNCQEDTIEQQPRRQESDVLSSKDSNLFQLSIGSPEIIKQKFAVEISGRDDDTTEQGVPTNDLTATPLTFKEERFHPETESTSLQGGQNTPGGKEFRQSIKKEEKYISLREDESKLEIQPLDVINKTVAQFHVGGCNSADKSKSDSPPVADSEDLSDKESTLKSSSSKRGDVQKSEKEKGRREIELWGVNYKSKINRDKLDLLIQYLKKDQDSDGTNSCKKGQYSRETSSNADSYSNHSRRKLNKASIVKNKNNSREMISLMSPKGSNFAFKTLRITERSKNSEKTEDEKSSKDEIMVEEIVDASKESMKCNNPCPKTESMEDDSWAEPNNKAAGLSKQHFQESSEKPVPKDKCAAQDENAIISTVRAFQNSKTHFCMSCESVSSIESFWINVVSGEVRCLNCLKKKTLKTEAKENVINIESNDLPDSSLKTLEKRKIKTEKENKSKDSAAMDDRNSWNEGERKKSSKCEDALHKLNGMKENVREELLEVFVLENHKSNESKPTTNTQCTTRRSNSVDGVDSQKRKPVEVEVLKTEKSARIDIYSEGIGRFSENDMNQRVKDVNATRRRKSFSEEEDFAKRERQPSSIKQEEISISKEYSEGGAKEETVKSEKLRGRRAYSSEEGPENRPKAEAKGVASSITRRNSDDCHRSVHLQCGEEFRGHKMSVIKERGQEDPKVRHFRDESSKPLPREGWPGGKDNAAEEAPKRSAAHETSDKSKSQNIWREGRVQRDQQCPSEAKTSKLFPRRDPKTPDALARTTPNQNGVENQKRKESTEQRRKRKNSDEDFSSHKVHVVEDLVENDSVQATHPSKSSEATVSKENDNSQRGSLWSARISREKSERSDASEEDCVLLGVLTRKDPKPPPEGDKAKLKDPRTGPGASQRAKPSGFVEKPRRKSKDEQWGPENAIGWRRTSEGPRRKSSDEESSFPSRASAMKLSSSSGPCD